MSTRFVIVWGVVVTVAAALVIAGFVSDTMSLVVGGVVMGLGAGIAARSYAYRRMRE